MFVRTSAGIVFLASFLSLDLEGRLDGVFAAGQDDCETITHNLSVGDWIDMPIRKRHDGTKVEVRFWISPEGFSQFPVPIFGIESCGYRG